MSVTSVSGQSAIAVQQLVNMRAQLDDLSRQLATGQKSANYAGLGIDRGVTVGLNAQLSEISAFDDTITNVSTRLKVMDPALSRMNDIGTAVRQAMVPASGIGNDAGVISVQSTAQNSLGEFLDLLNTREGDRYVFSGRATDTPAVVSQDLLLNGDAAHAGLRQVISERNQADLGTSGLGRLTITKPTTTSISVAEDAVSPFGFKLNSISSTITGATTTGPTGSPPAVSVSLTAVPNPGEKLTLRFNLPDGTTASATLTATTNSPPGPDEFTIGPDAATTTTNLQNALTTSVGKLASTSLTAASAVQASNEFFNADASTPPQRVNGPPFDTATSLTAGSSANTVIWYTGETGTDPARSSVTAKIDPSISVSYGVRANELGLRQVVQNIATLAAVDVPTTNPNAIGLSNELNQRLTTNILGSPSGESIQTIEADLGNTEATIGAVQDRHKQTSGVLSDLLDKISGVSNEEVGAEVLTLQTRMQATMQTTAILFQTSLVNFLK